MKDTFKMNKISAVLIFGLVGYVVCAGMPGAPSGVNTNDEVIQRMAAFAVGEIGLEYELVRVASATQQVVNGMIYTIEIVTRRITVGESNKKRHCKVQVYEIGHQGYLELEEFHCHFANKEPRL